MQTQKKESEHLAKAYLAIRTAAPKSPAQIEESASSALKGQKVKGNSSYKNNVFTVQFNPVELQFSTERGSAVNKSDFQEKNGKVSQDVCSWESVPSIHMSVHLIFDGTLDQNYNVKSKVEGLVAAATKGTRDLKMTFCWEKLSFTGVLEDISADYTMFDESGEPLRADADFTICCSDRDEVAEITDRDYQSLFK